MATRTVRLDDESEQILEMIGRAKGLSVSATLKQGLVALRTAYEGEGPSMTPFAIYRNIDLGRGGYARGKARRAKSEIERLLRAKRRR